MKVIKEGNLKKYNATCCKCNSLLEFNKMDIGTRYPSMAEMDIYPDALPVNYITCPVCGNIIFEDAFVDECDD